MQHTTVDYDSLRAEDFTVFAQKVLCHIDEYTVPQYGDKGADMATKKSPEWFVDQIARYTERFGKQARKGETKLDMLKIAHYAQLAHDAIQE